MTAWSRDARIICAGRIRAGGVGKDVVFTPVMDAGVENRIDQAYCAKCRTYGAPVRRADDRPRRPRRHPQTLPR